MAVLQGVALQVHARCLGELRRADQLALLAVGPAMHGAHDVSARIAQIAVSIACAAYVAGLAAQHNGLPVTADIGHQLYAIGAAHQYAAGMLLRQSAPVARSEEHTSELQSLMRIS